MYRRYLGLLLLAGVFAVIFFNRSDDSRIPALASLKKENAAAIGKNSSNDERLVHDSLAQSAARAGKRVAPPRRARVTVIGNDWSLTESADREAALEKIITLEKKSKSESFKKYVKENLDAWDRELELRRLIGQLEQGMTVAQTTNLLGAPTKVAGLIRRPDGPEYPGGFNVHTNGTWVIYSTHPSNRQSARVGDVFRVLELWFDEQGGLADGAWVKPWVD